MTSCLCVRGGFSESSQALLHLAASRCAPLLLLWMLLGCILEEGVPGSSDPPASAPLSLTWMTSEGGIWRGTRHRNVVRSAALRTGFPQRHFCTFLDLPRLICGTRKPRIDRNSSTFMCFYFRRPFPPHFLRDCGWNSFCQAWRRQTS